MRWLFFAFMLFMALGCAWMHSGKGIVLFLITGFLCSPLEKKLIPKWQGKLRVGTVIVASTILFVVAVFSADTTSNNAEVQQSQGIQIEQGELSKVVNLDDDVELTILPTQRPTDSPTVEPTVSPTIEPTATPTLSPTQAPTATPIAKPTVKPTDAPSPEPVEVKQADAAIGAAGIIVAAPSAEMQSGQTETTVVAPAPVQNVQQDTQEITYILNTKSHKFHRLNCKTPPTVNRQDSTLSREEIVAQGYDPCGNCKP